MTQEEKDKEQLILEQRKVKAMEKIANSLDALTIWFEEINKEEWSDRIQYYLHEFHKSIVTVEPSTEEVEETKPTKTRKTR